MANTYDGTVLSRGEEGYRQARRVDSRNSSVALSPCSPYAVGEPIVNICRRDLDG
ncbi:MAG: hypothetical protein WBQ21_13525 [Solirubrobacteraceae bacterium]